MVITLFCSAMAYPVDGVWLEPVSCFDKTMTQSTAQQWCNTNLGRKRLASAVYRSWSCWADAGPTWPDGGKNFPSVQSNLWEVLQEAGVKFLQITWIKCQIQSWMSVRPKLLQMEDSFNGNKVWSIKLEYKSFCLTLWVSCVCIFIYFATCLINKTMRFHDKCEIFWAIPNFWTIVCVYCWLQALTFISLKYDICIYSVE